MDTILGVACKDFTMLATDCSSNESILLMKTDEKKIYPLGERMMMGVAGLTGDTKQFAEYIGRNLRLYRMQNGYELSPGAVAHYTRHSLAERLRLAPFQLNILLGGFGGQGGELYFIDSLVSFQKVPFAAHGFGGMISYSIFDRFYKKDMKETEAYEMMKKCIGEIHHRLLLNQPSFTIHVADAKGNRQLKLITRDEVATKSPTPALEPIIPNLNRNSPSLVFSEDRKQPQPQEALFPSEDH